MSVTPRHGVVGNLDVHYSLVRKTNRKGVAAMVGGQLFDHPGNAKAGDFHIKLDTKVSGKPVTKVVEAGDVVFYTTSDKRNTVRWQILSKAAFKKRFPRLSF